MKLNLAIILLVSLQALSSMAQSGAKASTDQAGCAADDNQPCKISPQPKDQSSQAAKPVVPDTTLPSETTLNAFFHRMFGIDPNLRFKVVSVKPSPVAGLSDVITQVSSPSGDQMMRFFVSADQQHVIVGDLRPFGADPFNKSRAVLQKEAFGPAKGPASPAILLVEFGDLQCPACRSAQPAIEKLLSEMPNVKLIFQNYPLEEIHPWAHKAAAYLDCLARENNDTAWKFVSAVYGQQDAVNEQNETAGADAVTKKLNEIAIASGADGAKVSACALSQETKTRLERSKKMADDLEVRVTPTLFINGRPISNLLSLPYSTLKTLVEFEIAESRK